MFCMEKETYLLLDRRVIVRQIKSDDYVPIEVWDYNKKAWKCDLTWDAWKRHGETFEECIDFDENTGQIKKIWRAPGHWSAKWNIDHMMQFASEPVKEYFERTHATYESIYGEQGENGDFLQNMSGMPDLFSGAPGCERYFEEHSWYTHPLPDGYELRESYRVQSETARTEHWILYQGERIRDKEKILIKEYYDAEVMSRMEGTSQFVKFRHLDEELQIKEEEGISKGTLLDSFEENGTFYRVVFECPLCSYEGDYRE